MRHQIHVNTNRTIMKLTKTNSSHNITYENTAGLVHTNPPVLAMMRTVKMIAPILAGW